MENTSNLKKLFYDIFNEVTFDYNPKIRISKKYVSTTEIEFDRFDFNNFVNVVLETLDIRESCAIRNRYFKKMTFKETGKHIVNAHTNVEFYKKTPCDGITAERARQITCKAIRKMRSPSRLKFYPPYNEYQKIKLKEAVDALGQ